MTLELYDNTELGEGTRCIAICIAIQEPGVSQYISRYILIGFLAYPCNSSEGSCYFVLTGDLQAMGDV